MPLKFIYDPSLVLYLPLWKKDGAIFQSDDAYGHSCTVTTATWTPQGYNFAGADYITVPDNICLRNFANFSIMAWFKTLTDFSGGEGYVAAKYTTAGDAYIGLIIRTTNKAGFDYRDDDAVEPAGLSSIAVVNDGIWHCALFSRNTFTPYRFLMLDGIVQASGTVGIGTGLMSEADLNIRIGARSYSTPASFYTGLIGEFLFHNRALSILEGQRLYLATKWRYTP